MYDLTLDALPGDGDGLGNCVQTKLTADSNVSGNAYVSTIKTDAMRTKPVGGTLAMLINVGTLKEEPGQFMEKKLGPVKEEPGLKEEELGPAKEEELGPAKEEELGPAKEEPGPAQDTTHDSKLTLHEPHEGDDSKSSTVAAIADFKYSTATGGGDSKYSTATHDIKMPPNGDNGVTHPGPLNEMPPDGYLLAPELCAGGAPPNGAHFERLANEDQVNTTKDGDTLHKVASYRWLGPW